MHPTNPNKPSERARLIIIHPYIPAYDKHEEEPFGNLSDHFYRDEKLLDFIRKIMDGEKPTAAETEWFKKNAIASLDRYREEERTVYEIVADRETAGYFNTIFDNLDKIEAEIRKLARSLGIELFEPQRGKQ